MIDVASTAEVVTITMNAPERANALRIAAIDEITSVVASARESGPRVTVITGSGNSFSAGADLRAVESPVDRAAAFLRLYDAISACPIPVIARVNGHAYGGAIGLIAACDLSVAVSHATFGFTEPEMGMVATSAAIPFVRRVRRSDAAELLLTSRRFTADHAAAIGLVNRSVDPDELDRTVNEYVDGIRGGGPNALATSKLLVRELHRHDGSDVAALSLRLTAQVMAGTEAAEGRAAREQRRPPSWADRPDPTTPKTGGAS